MRSVPSETATFGIEPRREVSRDRTGLRPAGQAQQRELELAVAALLEPTKPGLERRVTATECCRSMSLLSELETHLCVQSVYLDNVELPDEVLSASLSYT